MSGFKILQDNGCPTFDDYNDTAIDDFDSDTCYLYWMNDFENYYAGMHNKIDSVVNIKWDSSYSSLELLKHWIHDHNEGDTTGGLAVITVYTYGWDWNNLFPPGSPEAFQHYVSQWGTSGGHALTIVGYHDEVHCFDFDQNGQYINEDIDNDGIIELSECEKGAFKVVNSWGTDYFGDSGYVYIPYKLMAEGLQDDTTAYTCYTHLLDEPQLIIKSNVEFPFRWKIRYEIGYAQNANQENQIDSTNFESFKSQGGDHQMRGAYDGPIETGLDFGHFFINDDFGKIFFNVKKKPFCTDVGTIKSFSIVDYRWDEVFELECIENNVSTIENKTYMSIDYDLIPHENTITHTDTLFSNMVSRFEPTVDNNSTLLIEQGVHVDFYNSNLIIKEGSTLIIEDSAVLYGKRGTSRIDIEGELQLGNNVTFIADSACELILNIKNMDTTMYFSVTNTKFDNADLHSYCDSLTVANNHFENGASLKKYGGSLLVTECEFDNSFIYAFEGQENSIIEIDSCSLHNPSINGSPLFIDSYAHYNIHDNVISYSYGTGISLYNSGGIEGIGTHIIKDNEVYYTGSKKSSLKNTGVKIYNSEADILDWNYIHDNDYGISCLNYSQTKITGDTVTQCTEVSQRIINNNDHQVYISSASIPINFNYNEIYESSYSTFFIYELTSQQSQITFDVTNNFWGNDLTGDPSDYIYTSLYPEWSPMCSYKAANSAMVTKYDSAVSYIVAGDYISAENTFKEIIEDSLGSNYSYASLNQLFEIKKKSDQDFVGLKNYIDATTMLQDTNDLGKMADIISNKCNIELENYQVAVNFFEDIILNSGSCQDSIFAIIDIGYLYLKMNSSKSITVTSLLPQYIPESRKTYETERDWLLDLLYVKHSGSPTENQETINSSYDVISNLVLFPNPSAGTMNIVFIIKNTLPLSFTIYDQSGKKVKEFLSNQYYKGNNNKKIDLSKLNNGIYYLSIKSNGKSVANEKIILIK